MMRIITGMAKGIRLKTLDGEATRPTTERVKEAVFSMLMGDIEGRKVLDLFSGSGQMALEALSRGALHATLVDKSMQAVKIITENAQKTKLQDRCTVVKDEYLSFIKKNRGNKYDIIFIDPPYESNYYQVALHAMSEGNMLKSTSMIICESDTEIILNSDLETKFSVIKQSKYGRIIITIFMPREKI